MKKQSTPKSGSSMAPHAKRATRQRQIFSQKKNKSNPRTFRQLAESAIDAAALADDQQAVLKACLGIAGFSRVPLAVDAEARQLWSQHLFAQLQNSLERDLRGHSLVRIQISDDCGISDAAAPRIFLKAMRDRANKLLETTGLEAFHAPFVTTGLDAEAREIIVVRQRALAFMPPDADISEVANILSRSAVIATRLAPRPALQVVGSETLEQEINRLFRLPTKACRLESHDNLNRSWKPGAMLDHDDVFRLIEILTAIPSGFWLSATGARARIIAGRAKSAGYAAHKARPALGTILSGEFDTFVLGNEIRQARSSAGVCVRTDLPLHPPAVPRVKSLAQLKRATTKKHKIMRNRLKPVAKKSAG